MAADKKKGTPGSAPIKSHNYDITPEGKVQWLADILFNMIEDDELMGRPIKRPINRTIDRRLRQKIEEANRNGDCIINLGDGYFRPNRYDEADVYAYRIYRAKELKRARTIIDKIAAMDKAFTGGNKWE